MNRTASPQLFYLEPIGYEAVALSIELKKKIGGGSQNLREFGEKNQSQRQFSYIFKMRKGKINSSKAKTATEKFYFVSTSRLKNLFSQNKDDQDIANTVNSGEHQAGL